MRIIDKKPYETPPNIFYGVDVTDKKAVKKKYLQLKFKHFVITIFVLVLLGIFGVFIFDMLRVNFFNKHPLIYKTEAVDGGVLYKGVGYSKLYCDNGEVYNYLNGNNKCLNKNRTFNQALYSAFKVYIINKKIIDNNELKVLKLSNITFDGANDKGGSDYMVDVTYSCFDEKSSKCFKELKKQKDPFTYKLFIVLNRENHVEEVKTFKDSGEYYNKLVADYTEKVRQYLLDKGLLDAENLRSFEVSLSSNHGKIKYKDVEYADSYLININCYCNDNTLNCLNNKELVDNTNYTNFEIAMLLDDNNNVGSLVNKAIFSK